MTALDKDGLLVQLVAVWGSDCMHIYMTTTNSSENTLEQYLVKVIPTVLSLLACTDLSLLIFYRRQCREVSSCRC